jgi:hypothetical protein
MPQVLVRAVAGREGARRNEPNADVGSLRRTAVDSFTRQGPLVRSQYRPP